MLISSLLSNPTNWCLKRRALHPNALPTWSVFVAGQLGNGADHKVKLLFTGFIMHTPMPSLIYKGGVGEGFAVPGSKSVQADAKRYYPIVSASTNSPKLAANRQCLLPNPPYPPLHKGGMAGAHIDTRYIQTDKQQFCDLLLYFNTKACPCRSQA